MQGYLYSKCIQNDNIILAIKEINKLQSSFTAGPDGISLKNKINQDIAIKEVKLRLRRYKRINSFIKNDICIINLYDRYAQQAVYQVINSIIEPKMNVNSYFKTKISMKVPVSKIANIIKASKKNTYIISMNLRKYFNYISLNQALKSLKELGIDDHLLIITIKHLMWVSREYNGIGLNYGTILGTLLYNCYFNQLNNFMANNFDLIKYSGMKMINYQNHKDNWIEWLKQRNHKIQCRYCRYLNEVIILTTIKQEQLYINNQILNFIQTTMQLNIQQINYAL